MAMSEMVKQVLEAMGGVERELEPSERWRNSLRVNLAAGLGGVFSWTRHLGAASSGEEEEGGLVASHVDLVAAEGIAQALDSLARGEDPTAARLVMEASRQPRGVFYGPPEERRFAREELDVGREVTVLVDPVDGTTNLRDGRILQAATVVASSRPLPPKAQATFGDVLVASTWFLASTPRFALEIRGLLATPTGLWEVSVDPLRGQLLGVNHLDREHLQRRLRRVHQIVFASYYAASPQLARLEVQLAELGYPLAPGCGSSALDCLRILSLEEGAYVDLRARLPHLPARLHTYDVASIPFTAAVMAQTTGEDVRIYTAGPGLNPLSQNHLKKSPLLPAPISFLLVHRLDPQPLLELLERYWPTRRV